MEKPPRVGDREGARRKLRAKQGEVIEMGSYVPRGEPVLRRQLLALESLQYEFMVFDGTRATRRVWRLDQALRSAKWLGRKNVRGAHIYLRPAGTDYVLVDDATDAGLRRMGADGLAAAAVVETSPDNYQVWLRFERPLGRELATCVGQVLASRYDGDPASVDFRHLGRAAGFTNRKAEHRRPDGRFPWVRLVSASGALTGGARELRAAGEMRLRKKVADREEVARRVNGAVSNRGRRRTASGFYEDEVQRLRLRYGSATDASRADAAAARKMALEGFSEAEVVAALAASADVRERKRGHVEDYARRTAAWAFGKTPRARTRG